MILNPFTSSNNNSNIQIIDVPGTSSSDSGYNINLPFVYNKKYVLTYVFRQFGNSPDYTYYAGIAGCTYIARYTINNDNRGGYPHQFDGVARVRDNGSMTDKVVFTVRMKGNYNNVSPTSIEFKAFNTTGTIFLQEV